MRDYFLQTERIGFSRWRNSDFRLALMLWGNPRVTKLIDARPALTQDAVRERLESEIALYEAHGIQYFPIFLLENDGFVGCCGLRPHYRTTGALEVGVHVRPDYWRRGIAFEASTGMIDYAFNTLGARILMMGHHPANALSRTLIEKLGFEFSHTERYEATGLDHPTYWKGQPS